MLSLPDDVLHSACSVTAWHRHTSGCRTHVRPCPHGATRAIHTFPCHVVSAWPHAAMEARANRWLCHVAMGPRAARHTRDTRGPMRKQWASRGSHVSPCNPGQHGPRWARISVGSGALPVTYPCRHGLACAWAGRGKWRAAKAAQGKRPDVSMLLRLSMGMIRFPPSKLSQVGPLKHLRSCRTLLTQ